MIIHCAGQFGSNNQNIKDIDFDYFLNILNLNSLSILKILQLMNKHDKLNILIKSLVLAVLEEVLAKTIKGMHIFTELANQL